MSDDLPIDDKEGIERPLIKTLLEHLVRTYNDHMEYWAEKIGETEGAAPTAAAYGLAAFDILNLLLMMDGDFEQVENNQKAAETPGSLKLVRVEEEALAAYQGPLWPSINAPGDDPEADPEDPTRWN